MVKVQRLFAKTNLKVPICRTYRTITQKCLQLELPTENSVYSQENRNRAGNYAHLTSENGKCAVLTSGRPAFQQHVKHAEGSNTPLPRTFRKYCAQSEKNSNITKLQTDHAAQRGCDAFGTATRISASLFRRLSAFFGSTPGQDPKAAKYAVLTPGPGMFVNVQYVSRVVIAAPSGRPLFRRVCPCVRSFSESRGCTRFRL